MGRREAQSLPGWGTGEALLSQAVRQAAWDLCRYRWIIWLKCEEALHVISIAVVGKTMYLYDRSQWSGVCVYIEKRRGPRTDSLLANQLWRTYLERKCKPVKCISGDERVEKNLIKCQKHQISLAEWELMIWAKLLQSIDSVTDSKGDSVECPLLNPDWLFSSRLFCKRKVETWSKHFLILQWKGGERQACSFQQVFCHVTWQQQ